MLVSGSLVTVNFQTGKRGRPESLSRFPYVLRVVEGGDDVYFAITPQAFAQTTIGGHVGFALL